jgi:hypothetical protein
MAKGLRSCSIIRRQVSAIAATTHFTVYVRYYVLMVCRSSQDETRVSNPRTELH